MNAKIIAISIIAIAAVLAGVLFFKGRSSNEAYALDAFAQCLSEKGMVMYGAYWCPHCQNEKKAFGSSFEYVSYVECTKEPKLCTEAGIKGFPTWIDAAGARFEGEQGLSRLSEISGCSLTALPLPE